MANYYKYDEATGVYLGHVPASGHPAALPPDNTTTKAPDLTPGKWPIWRGESWRYVEDYRDQIAWAKDLSGTLAIQDLGPIPEGYTLKQPPPMEEGYSITFDHDADDWTRTATRHDYYAWRKADKTLVIVHDPDAIPPDLTLTPPPEPHLGYAVQWDDAADDWQYIADHRGAGGYVNGEYTTITDLGPLPETWEESRPLSPQGYLTQWNKENAAWESIEDHRGVSGYLNGEYTTIAEPGPLPEGWSTEPPPPPPEDPDTVRLRQIDAELNAIDRAWVRPARAKMAGTATPDDEALIVILEELAQQLRAERTTLTARMETANA